MIVKEVIVDRRVLAEFKKRALKAYPKELLEVVVGEVRGAKAKVFCFQDYEHTADRRNAYVDADAHHAEDQDDCPHKIIGTVHSHPNDIAKPSPCDRRSAKREGEQVFGICAIRKRNKRRFVSWGFFNHDGKPVELFVAED